MTENTHPKCKFCGPLKEGEYLLYDKKWHCKACSARRKRKSAEKNKERLFSYKQEWYRANERLTKMRAKNRRERMGNELLEEKREYYRKNAEDVKAKVKLYKANLKRLVMSRYCGDEVKCENCGIDDVDVLCLDHIDDNGSAHRKQTGVMGNSVYLWVKRNNFPKIFQVLCFNCNMKKHSVTKSTKPKNYSLVIKNRVILHYGNGVASCVTCFNNDISLLCIDHINGGGNKHRKTVKSGLTMYRWLIKNEYPTGYQTLCFNCNFKKNLTRM